MKEIIPIPLTKKEKKNLEQTLHEVMDSCMTSAWSLPNNVKYELVRQNMGYDSTSQVTELIRNNFTTGDSLEGVKQTNIILNHFVAEMFFTNWAYSRYDDDDEVNYLLDKVLEYWWNL